MKVSDLKQKEYLGDGVYCGYDGWQIWLWTDHGFGPDQRPIALEPAVLERLNAFDRRISEESEDVREG